MRINRYLASCGIASRRKCETFIKEGRVHINGELVTNLATLVDPTEDQILFDHILVKPVIEYSYFLLNKPIGYVSSMDDEHQDHLITELYEHKVQKRLIPAGRLDRDSEGLIVLTDDGELIQCLLHPRYQVPRIYHVQVTPRFTNQHLDILAGGMELYEGHTGPITCHIRASSKEATEVSLTLYQGWKRQIRRMFQLLGFSVGMLKRVCFGPLQLNGLASGAVRELTEQEKKAVLALKK